MNKTLLQVNASLFSGAGQSSLLANEFVAGWNKRNPGATVIVRDLAGREVGRGLSRYDAADAARIVGLKSDAIEPVLGYSAGPLIHADDLALAG